MPAAATKPPKRKRSTPPANAIALPKFRGGSLELLLDHGHECVISGPADCAKTWACCTKSFVLCNDPKRPGVHGIMVRKLFNSIQESGARTFNTITEGMGIQRLGGKTYTDRWLFKNGSELVTAGLDNPGKLLSSEWDFIQVIQSEQLTEDEWEMVAGRCTGRGAKVAYPQIFGDCNPAGSMHWLRTRKSLRLIPSVHKDNPALYDDAGNILPEGIRRIGFLESTLTGVRRKRLLEGIWATAEGAVYDMFDSTLGTGHVRVRDSKEMKRWFLAMDEGYVHPAVILLIGEDGDGRHHCFKEFYKSGVLQSVVVATAREWFQEHHCEAAAVDEAAAGLIADLNDAGVYAKGSKGRVLDGINLVQNRMKMQGDGRPRFSVDPSCINFVNELESYVWNDKALKDAPKKENDDAADAYRYLLDYLHEGTGAFQSVGDLHGGGTQKEARPMDGARIGAHDRSFFG